MHCKAGAAFLLCVALRAQTYLAPSGVNEWGLRLYQILKRLFRTKTLCISLIEAKSPSRSEHLNGKTATIGTFFKGMKMILRKKVPYYLHEILRYLCKPKCFKKYQRLQFYVLYVPILDETPYIVTKCTVQNGNTFSESLLSMTQM